jgi:long-chain acyl-CoA synthetase
VVIDRAKDVLHTADGTMFSPAFIENKIKFSPFVEEAVIFGGTGEGAGGDDITALITIDMPTVGTWAEHEQLSYTTYTDLAGKPEVYGWSPTRPPGQPGPRGGHPGPAHRAAAQAFDPDDDEITRTRKVRRNVVNDRYAEIIAALGGATTRSRSLSQVTYQDGTSAERELTSHRDRPTSYCARRRRVAAWRGA